jgi:hypothetical protein
MVEMVLFACRFDQFMTLHRQGNAFESRLEKSFRSEFEAIFEGALCIILLDSDSLRLEGLDLVPDELMEA